jgi:hypothetical protein
MVFRIIKFYPESGSSTSVEKMAAAAPATQPTLKVMRLYKPRLSLEQSYCRDFTLSNMLLLPDSFGYVHHCLHARDERLIMLVLMCANERHNRNIYLGETFSSYISVINHFACEMSQVGLTVMFREYLV